MTVQFPHFYRNARAGELLELFFVAAISGVLLTRAWLHLTGFPTIGGLHLHIAHVLWGGFFMLIAIVVFLTFLGSKARRLASVLGGIGFGLFIDELGKFITRDNNYFYRPAIGLIYLTFVILFIVIRLLSQKRRLSQQEYLLNALSLTQEATIHNLDESERQQALHYLAEADQSHPLVPALTGVLRQTSPLIRTSSQTHRLASLTQEIYERIIAHPRGAKWFNWAFFIHSILFFGIIVLLFIQELVYERINIESYIELASAAIPPALVVFASIVWRRNRLKRYRLFSIALLMNIFVTQFFSFYHDQFSALPGFVVTLLFYIGVRSLIKHEEQLRAGAPI